jgi:hypothetical protein
MPSALLVGLLVSLECTGGMASRIGLLHEDVQSKEADQDASQTDRQTTLR